MEYTMKEGTSVEVKGRSSGLRGYQNPFGISCNTLMQSIPTSGSSLTNGACSPEGKKLHLESLEG